MRISAGIHYGPIRGSRPINRPAGSGMMRKESGMGEGHMYDGDCRRARQATDTPAVRALLQFGVNTTTEIRRFHLWWELCVDFCRDSLWR